MTSSPRSVTAFRPIARAPKPALVIAMSAGSNGMPRQSRSEAATTSRDSGSLSLYAYHRSSWGTAQRCSPATSPGSAIS